MLACVHFGSKEDRIANGIIRFKDWIMVGITLKDSLPNQDKPKITLRGYAVPTRINDQPFGHLTLTFDGGQPTGSDALQPPDLSVWCLVGLDQRTTYRG